MKKIWLILMVVLLNSTVYGLRVELSNDTFSTTGRAANRNLFVTNNSEKMIALEVYAQSRIMDPISGVDELDDVEDFLIYPNQLLLQPDEQQVVTLTWVGDQELEQERPFRIIVEELNLSLGEEDDGAEEMTVKVAALTKVVKAAYVAPPEAKANVKITDAEVITNEDGEKRIKITFDNVGTAHKILKQTMIKLTPMSGGNKQTDEVKEYVPDELNGVVNILAKSQRIIEVSWPEDISSDYTEVNVSL